MASDIKQKLAAASAALTITLASLADGSGRASTAIDNSSALNNSVDLHVKIKTGASGVSAANGRVEVWLIQSENGTNFDDAFAGSDAAYTPINAVLLGIMTANANSTTFEKTFSSDALGILLSRKWAIGIVNRTAAALDGTAGNHAITYTMKLLQST